MRMTLLTNQAVKKNEQILYRHYSKREHLDFERYGMY